MKVRGIPHENDSSFYPDCRDSPHSYSIRQDLCFGRAEDRYNAKKSQQCNSVTTLNVDDQYRDQRSVKRNMSGDKPSLFLGYDINDPRHLDPVREWQPHGRQTIKTLEWWYVNGLLYDAEKNPYFFVWAPLHMVGEKNLPPGTPNVLPGYRCVLAVVGFADYHNKLTINDTDVGFMNETNIWDPGRNELCFEIPSGLSMPPEHPADFTSKWSYDGKLMDLQVSSPHLSFNNLHFTGGQRVLYARDKRHKKEGLIQQGSRLDWSYYYSLPGLSVTGQIKYTDDNNKEHVIDVEGKAWVDRQWGDFTTVWWEWSCLLFDSGARADLYSFCNDYKVGSYQKDDGLTQWFDCFTLERHSYIPTPAGKWLSWGWTYEFEDVDIEGSRHYTLNPWSKKDVHDSFYSFFEGPSYLINDETGEQVGYAVTESMDILNMRNGPVAPRDKGLGLYPP